MRITAAELVTVALPLVSPFRTSLGSDHDKAALLVRVVTDEAEGWGECVASPEPLYSSEYLTGAAEVIRRFLLPPLLVARDLRAADVVRRLAHVSGHRMAKAAVEMAVLDAELRTAGVSLARRLGGVTDTVPSGVSVGIMDSVPELLDAVDAYLSAGYARIKLKIEPGWDVDVVDAVRERFGDIPLQVDANAAYTLSDAPHLARLDRYGLLLIEQPLQADDLRQHAVLSRRLATPICLDESITSARSAADAIALGACTVVNIKAGRVGGYLEATTIHDLAVANGVAVWCGGMVETGLGRAANAALASLPGFTLVGDVSASDRFFTEDLTEPVEMHNGRVQVPTGPGIGRSPIDEVLHRRVVTRETVTSADP
jgi:O-succinylbenzoate synthase